MRVNSYTLIHIIYCICYTHVYICVCMYHTHHKQSATPNLVLQERLTLLERLEQRPLKVRPKEDYERIVRSLTEEELESMMDLRPFMQRNPFVVQADANLSRTYRLFRTMGLRHLFVGPPQPKA